MSPCMPVHNLIVYPSLVFRLDSILSFIPKPRLAFVFFGVRSLYHTDLKQWHGTRFTLTFFELEWLKRFNLGWTFKRSRIGVFFIEEMDVSWNDMTSRRKKTAPWTVSFYKNLNQSFGFRPEWRRFACKFKGPSLSINHSISQYFHVYVELLAHSFVSEAIAFPCIIEFRSWIDMLVLPFSFCLFEVVNGSLFSAYVLRLLKILLMRLSLSLHWIRSFKISRSSPLISSSFASQYS